MKGQLYGTYTWKFEGCRNIVGQSSSVEAVPDYNNRGRSIERWVSVQLFVEDRVNLDLIIFFYSDGKPLNLLPHPVFPPL